MGLVTGFLDSRDIVSGFFPALEAAQEKMWANQLAMLIPTDRETENYRWLGQVAQMRKWVGGRHEQVLKKYSMQITNEEYESTLALPVPDLRRDKSGLLSIRVADLAGRTATHWNTLLSTLISAGDGGTLGLAYDGQYFFDTDHAESGTNQKNSLGASEVPSSNVSSTTIPTAAEAANIIVETIGYIYGLKDDQGEPINQDAKAFTIMVTTSAHWAAFSKALSLELLDGSTSNPIMALKTKGITIDVIFNPRLSGGAKVYFFRTDGTIKPLILQEEVPVNTKLIGAGSEEEFKNNRHLFGVNATRAVGFGAWQGAALVTLS